LAARFPPQGRRKAGRKGKRMSYATTLAEELDMGPDDLLLEDPRGASVPPSDTIPARATFALAVIYLLLLLVASRYTIPGGALGTGLLVLMFVYLPVAIIYQGVRIPMSLSTETIAGLIAVGVWLGLVGIEPRRDAALIIPARSVALLAACLFFGMVMSRILRERNILLPALIVAAAVDVLSVGWGFTGQAVHQAPDIVSKLSVAVPRVTPPSVPGATPHFAVLASMGVGDFFFLAFFFAAAARFRLPLRRTFLYVFPLMALAMFMTLADPLHWGGVPGLPFIALGFLAANYREFDLSSREKRDIVIVGAIMAVFIAAMFVLKALIAKQP
jgi:peptidoglycan/LPS O-acetylase OafA/YrhL